MGWGRALGTKYCTHSKEGHPNKSRSQDNCQELYLAGTQTPAGRRPAPPRRLVPTELLMPATHSSMGTHTKPGARLHPHSGVSCQFFPFRYRPASTGGEVGWVCPGDCLFLLQAKLPHGCIRLSTSARGTSGCQWGSHSWW